MRDLKKTKGPTVVNKAVSNCVALSVSLTLCDLGGPKDPQLSKLPIALKWVFRRDWSVYDFSFIYFKTIFSQKGQAKTAADVTGDQPRPDEVYKQ